jgi:hypothetical protein
MSSSEAAIRIDIVPCEHVFGKGTCAGPQIVVGALHHAGPDGVVQDVVDRVSEVRLRVDHPGGESGAEEMARASVSLVEAKRVRAVKPLDAGGELRLRRVENEVDVVVHQAERMALPAVTGDGCGQAAEIGEPIQVVADDRRAVDAACRHVEVTVRESRTEDARHSADGRRRATAAVCAAEDCHAFVTASVADQDMSQCRIGTCPRV